ncbi:hypothetical protein KJ612_12010 [Myxococcota bacterium]|nr:hypothetical protein [Myxococcota bacterium]
MRYLPILLFSLILGCSGKSQKSSPSNCAPGCVAPDLCDEGKAECVPGCGNRICADDQVCDPEMLTCVDIPASCEPATCVHPYTCNGDPGECVHLCSLLTCETGRCDETTAECVGLCVDVTCDAGFVCDELRGMCVGLCDGRICNDGEACNPQTGVCEPESSQACTADQVPQPNTGIVAPAGLDGCPAGMARSAVAGVCMDRWEAHLVEVAQDGSTQPWSPYFNPGTVRVRAVSAPGAVPQGYITQVQATAACAEAGRRLCSRAQWEAVCAGASGWTYPYGTTRQPGVCNDARTPHPVVEYFGTSEEWIWSELGHPCINQLHDSLDRTGDNAGCVTPEGFFDLMGNLHEWIDDPAGTFKGGYYVDTVINGNGCLYTTTAHNVSHWDYSTGFRCCADSP